VCLSLSAYSTIMCWPGDKLLSCPLLGYMFRSGYSRKYSTRAEVAARAKHVSLLGGGIKWFIEDDPSPKIFTFYRENSETMRPNYRPAFCSGLTIKLLNFFSYSLIHRYLIYIKCSLELVHLLAARAVALNSGAKTGAAWVSTSFLFRTLWFDFI